MNIEQTLGEETIVMPAPVTRTRTAPRIDFLENQPKHSSIWIKIGMWLLIIPLLAYSYVKHMSLDSRLSMVSSKHFQNLPYQEFLDSIIFKNNTQSAIVQLKKESPFTITQKMPVHVQMVANLKINAQDVPTEVQVKVKPARNKTEAIIDQVVQVEPVESTEIFLERLDAGEYQIEFTRLDGEEKEILTAELTLHQRY